MAGGYPKMKVTYWPDVDILDIRLKDGKIKESDELSAGIVADFDADGNIVGLEILDASERVDEPQNMMFESMGHIVAGRAKGKVDVRETTTTWAVRNTLKLPKERFELWNVVGDAYGLPGLPRQRDEGRSQIVLQCGADRIKAGVRLMEPKSKEPVLWIATTQQDKGSDITEFLTSHDFKRNQRLYIKVEGNVFTINGKNE